MTICDATRRGAALRVDVMLKGTMRRDALSLRGRDALCDVIDLHLVRQQREHRPLPIGGISRVGNDHGINKQFDEKYEYGCTLPRCFIGLVRNDVRPRYGERDIKFRNFDVLQLRRRRRYTVTHLFELNATPGK